MFSLPLLEAGAGICQSVRVRERRCIYPVVERASCVRAIRAGSAARAATAQCFPVHHPLTLLFLVCPLLLPAYTRKPSSSPCVLFL